MARKKSTDKPSEPKSKTLFDHINEIRLGKNPIYFETLSDGDKKTWSNYMVCRFLSMQPDLIEYINEIQRYSGVLEPREFYKVLIELVPKGKAYYPYVKSAAEKENPQLVLLLSSYFKDSQRNVREYMKILSRDDIRGIVKSHGYSEKEIEDLMES